LKCPSCEGLLKLSAPLAPGKAIKCPKCGAAVPAPAATGKSGGPVAASRPAPRPQAVRKPKPEEEPDEEAEDLDEEEAPRPKKAARRAADDEDERPSKRKRKKTRDEDSSRKKLLWIGIGGGAALLVGIVVLVFILKGSGSGGGKSPGAEVADLESWEPGWEPDPRADAQLVDSVALVGGYEIRLPKGYVPDPKVDSSADRGGQNKTFIARRVSGFVGGDFTFKVVIHSDEQAARAHVDLLVREHDKERLRNTNAKYFKESGRLGGLAFTRLRRVKGKDDYIVDYFAVDGKNEINISGGGLGDKEGLVFLDLAALTFRKK